MRARNILGPILVAVSLGPLEVCLGTARRWYFAIGQPSSAERSIGRIATAVVDVVDQ